MPSYPCSAEWLKEKCLFIFPPSGEDLGKTVADIRWRVRHCAFRSRGETWVMDAEIRVVRILSMKHRDAGAEGCWAEGYLSWAWQPTQWAQEGKGSFSEGTVLIRGWPWLVENRLWNYPSWDNKKYFKRWSVVSGTRLLRSGYPNDFEQVLPPLRTSVSSSVN